MSNDERNSLDLAHEYIPISYEWMLNRIAAAEARVETLIAQSATVMVAAVVAVTALNKGTIPIGWTLAAGIVAAILFLFITVMGVRTRGKIKLHMTNPSSFIEEHEGHQPRTWIEYPRPDFIEAMLEEAGKDTKHNTKTVNDTASKCELMGFALIGELVASLVWVSLSPIF